jgi:hypothetical protein
VLCHIQFQDTHKLSNRSHCMDQTMRREVRTELHPNNMTRGRPSEQGMKNFHSLRKRKENSMLQRKIILAYWPFHDETDPGAFLLHLCLLPYSLLRFSICLLFPTSPFSVSFYLHHLPTVLNSATTTLLPLAHYAHHPVHVQHNHFIHAVYCCWSVLKMEAGGSS